MSQKAFEKCKKEILSNLENSNDFGIDEALDLVDNYNLSTEELDAIFEIIRGTKIDEITFIPVKSDLQLLFEKYCVKLQRRRRYYKEDLTTRDYTLAHTTPYCMMFRDFCSNKHSWGDLLIDLTNYLCSKSIKSLNELIYFHTEWTKQDIFLVEKRTNHKLLHNGLFLNCNHSALHACWLIQDLLNFFCINTNEVEFYIHRAVTNEPRELRVLLENEFKKEFKEFLMVKHDKTDELAEKIINNIEKVMNPRLSKISSTYSNFFMFDDYIMYLNYAGKFEKIIDGDLRIVYKNKQIIKRYLCYLREFYKQSGY